MPDAPPAEQPDEISEETTAALEEKLSTNSKLLSELQGMLSSKEELPAPININ